jgi:delta14-sterol reductase
MTPELRGWLYVPFIYAFVFFLHMIVPPWHGVEGYACDSISGKPLLYRYNGLYVLIIVVVLSLTVVPMSWREELVVCWGGTMPCSCVLGLVISYLLYSDGKRRLAEGKVDRGASCLVNTGRRSAAAKNTKEFDSRTESTHFYCGVDWNPRFLGVDIKMYNYLVGAIMLALNILSALSVHMHKRKGLFGRGEPSNAMKTYCACFFFFIIEYLYFEYVHVYTYDIFRERTGMKMVWGCFFFYPFFYCIGVWNIVNATKRDISVPASIAIGCLYLTGWVLTRGANMQKFYWRTEKRPTFLWMKNKCVPGSHERILCSGFWSISRHVNYFGEIIQALALALCGLLVSQGSDVSDMPKALRLLQTVKLLQLIKLLRWLQMAKPFLYPLYYVALFVPRQKDDDQACLEKYGKVWKVYEEMVPYRIVPGVY